MARFSRPRERFSGQHRVQNSAVIRRFSGRQDQEDICVVRKATEEEVELRGLGVQGHEAGGGRGGVCVPGSAVLECLHNIGETLMPVSNRVLVARFRSDRCYSEEGRPLE